MVLSKVVLSILCLICALTDVSRQKIYNWFTLSTLLFVFLIHFTFYGWGGVIGCLKSTFIVLIFLLIFWKLRVLGAGDVKLGLATASLVGYGFFFGIFLCSSVLGAIFGIIGWTFFDKKSIPFALFFCLGFFLYQTLLLICS